MQQQHELKHSGYFEGDLTAFEEDNSTRTSNCSSQVWSGQKNKRCADGASRIKVKNRAYATKITDVVETCTRNGRDVIGEGRMRIKNETEVTSRDSRRNRLTISDKKSRIVDFI